MGDIDQNQFQTQQTHEIANETVAEHTDAENIASQLDNNNFISWTERMDERKKIENRTNK